MNEETKEPTNNLKIFIRYAVHMLLTLGVAAGVAWFSNEVILEHAWNDNYFIFSGTICGVIVLCSLLERKKIYTSVRTMGILMACFLVSGLLLLLSDFYVNLPIWLIGGIAAAALANRNIGMLYLYYFVFHAIYLQGNWMNGLVFHFVVATLIAFFIPKMKTFLSMFYMMAFSACLVVTGSIIHNQMYIDEGMMLDTFYILCTYLICIFVTMLLVKWNGGQVVAMEEGESLVPGNYEYLEIMAQDAAEKDAAAEATRVVEENAVVPEEPEMKEIPGTEVADTESVETEITETEEKDAAEEVTENVIEEVTEEVTGVEPEISETEVVAEEKVMQQEAVEKTVEEMPANDSIESLKLAVKNLLEDNDIDIVEESVDEETIGEEIKEKIKEEIKEEIEEEIEEQEEIFETQIIEESQVEETIEEPQMEEIIEELQEEEAVEEPEEEPEPEIDYSPYCDEKAPLLQELRVKDKSAHARAILVGKLASETAESIGLNVNLTKAGGLYKIIGKIRENSNEYTAAEVAKENNFPEALIYLLEQLNHNIIEQKEAAVILMTDGVISYYSIVRAAKKMDIPVEKIVDTIVSKKIFQGEFNESGLNMQECYILREKLIALLKAQDNKHAAKAAERKSQV